MKYVLFVLFVCISVLGVSKHAFGDTVHILVDTSKSMKGPDLEHAWRATQRLAAMLEDRAEVLVFRFSGVRRRGRCELTMKPLSPNATQPPSVRGCSPLAQALAKATDQISSAGQKKIVVAITRASDSRRSDLLEAVTRARDRDVRVVLVGTVRGSESSILREATSLVGLKMLWRKGFFPARGYPDVYRIALAPYLSPLPRQVVKRKPVVVQSAPVRVAQPEPVVIAAPLKPRPASRSKIWPWVVMGVGAGVAGVGGYLGYSASSEFEDFRTKPMTDSNYVETRDSIDRRWIAADVLFGVSAVAIGAGLAWLLWPEGNGEQQ